MLMIGQKIAEISPNWQEINSYMEELTKETKTVELDKGYLKLKKKVVVSIWHRIKYRYEKKSKEEIKLGEKIYPVPFDVAVSRLQRNFEKSKYDEKDSTFFIVDNYAGEKTSWNSEISLTVKLFPEAGGKTAVVFGGTYLPVYDNMAGKPVFGKGESEKYLKSIIRNIGKILS